MKNLRRDKLLFALRPEGMREGGLAAREPGKVRGN